MYLIYIINNKQLNDYNFNIFQNSKENENLLSNQINPIKRNEKHTTISNELNNSEKDLLSKNCSLNLYGMKMKIFFDKIYFLENNLFNESQMDFLRTEKDLKLNFINDRKIKENEENEENEEYEENEENEENDIIDFKEKIDLPNGKSK